MKVFLMHFIHIGPYCFKGCLQHFTPKGRCEIFGKIMLEWEFWSFYWLPKLRKKFLCFFLSSVCFCILLNHLPCWSLLVFSCMICYHYQVGGLEHKVFFTSSKNFFQNTELMLVSSKSGKSIEITFLQNSVKRFVWP